MEKKKTWNMSKRHKTPAKNHLSTPKTRTTTQPQIPKPSEKHSEIADNLPIRLPWYKPRNKVKEVYNTLREEWWNMLCFKSSTNNAAVLRAKRHMIDASIEKSVIFRWEKKKYEQTRFWIMLLVLLRKGFIFLKYH